MLYLVGTGAQHSRPGKMVGESGPEPSIKDRAGPSMDFKSSFMIEINIAETVQAMFQEINGSSDTRIIISCLLSPP